jgi:RNA polymerase primary sigma factor
MLDQSAFAYQLAPLTNSESILQTSNCHRPWSDQVNLADAWSVTRSLSGSDHVLAFVVSRPSPSLCKRTQRKDDDVPAIFIESRANMQSETADDVELKAPAKGRAAATKNRAAQSPLETYLREINETALLTAEDEYELAERISQGDVMARDRMVRANLRLVVNIARGYTGKGLGLQDLIEEGNLGLLRAVEGFDPNMGTRFSTYASYWIKQSIKRALINSAKTIRIPAYMVELLSKWRRATARLSEELGRTPTNEEVARVLGLPKKKLPIIRKAIRINNSTPQSDQTESGWSLGEMVMDERLKSPDEEMLDHDILKHAIELLGQLDERDATVLKLRFGLAGEEPKTLKEIGAELGLTRERVRQIETEALRRLADGLTDPRDRGM